MKHRVAAAADLADGTMLHVEPAGVPVALYRSGDRFYATGDVCTHRRARLSDGFLEGTVVQCPLHFGKFDIATGRPLNPPCTVPLPVYPVSREGDDLYVIVGESPPSIAITVPVT